MSQSTLVESDRILFETTFKQVSDGTVVNLTGGTVQFRYRIDRGVSTQQTATVTDAANGVAQYRMGATELKPGLLEYEWQYTDSGGLVFNSDKINTLSIRRKL